MNLGRLPVAATCLSHRQTSVISNRVVTPRKINRLWEEPTPEDPRDGACPAGNRRPRELRIRFFSSIGHRLCGSVSRVGHNLSAASSRRQGHQRDRDHMRAHTTSPRNTPVESTTVEQFDAFDTPSFQVSNKKTPYGTGELTHLTDLTENRMGGTCRAGTRARHTRSRAHISTRLNNRQIRQIRQTARRQRAKTAGFHPPGVKSVKWTGVSDSGVTL